MLILSSAWKATPPPHILTWINSWSSFKAGLRFHLLCEASTYCSILKCKDCPKRTQTSYWYFQSPLTCPILPHGTYFHLTKLIYHVLLLSVCCLMTVFCFAFVPLVSWCTPSIWHRVGAQWTIVWGRNVSRTDVTLPPGRLQSPQEWWRFRLPFVVVTSINLDEPPCARGHPQVKEEGRPLPFTAGPELFDDKLYWRIFDK